MEFYASIHSIKVDNEGESRIQLLCPQSELLKVVALTQETQKLLKVTVEVE